jgi:hypothetical protein
MAETINAYKILIGKPQGKTPLRNLLIYGRMIMK